MADDDLPPSGSYENGGAGFELVMPFVCVASKGGPFDDDSFVAGFECGRVDALLAVADRSERLEMAVCRSALAGQFDLIAMRHGYTVEVTASEQWPEWASASFAPIGE